MQTMKKNNALGRLGGAILTSCILASMTSPALAGKGGKGGGQDDVITLMQFSDLHGKMIPHEEIFPGGRAAANSGGLAKVATMVKQIRADNPNSLLLNVGDTTHGDGRHNHFFREHFDCHRLLLAATELAFTHPYTGEAVEIRAPLDDDFRRVAASLGWSEALSAAQ